MEPDDLVNGLQTVALTKPDCLLFNPVADKAWLRGKVDDIPRYLFRITTPLSDGFTDGIWVKSKDARHGRADSRRDIFAVGDNTQAACMLYKHLRWQTKPQDPDNFTSWTSSLLFALQYIFYRHKHPKDRSNLKDILLCIIDTASFTKGTFLKDMDLLNAYGPFDSHLRNHQEVREKKHSNFYGSLYFGEYLSQGALKIEDRCQLVSSQAIIDQGLFKLQPELMMSMTVTKPSLANEVIRLREPFYVRDTPPQSLTKDEI